MRPHGLRLRQHRDLLVDRHRRHELLSALVGRQLGVHPRTARRGARRRGREAGNHQSHKHAQSSRSHGSHHKSSAACPAPVWRPVGRGALGRRPSPAGDPVEDPGQLLGARQHRCVVGVELDHRIAAGGCEHAPLQRAAGSRGPAGRRRRRAGRRRSSSLRRGLHRLRERHDRLRAAAGDRPRRPSRRSSRRSRRARPRRHRRHRRVALDDEVGLHLVAGRPRAAESGRAGSGRRAAGTPPRRPSTRSVGAARRRPA